MMSNTDNWRRQYWTTLSSYDVKHIGTVTASSIVIPHPSLAPQNNLSAVLPGKALPASQTIPICFTTIVDRFGEALGHNATKVLGRESVYFYLKYYILWAYTQTLIQYSVGHMVEHRFSLFDWHRLEGLIACDVIRMQQHDFPTPSPRRSFGL